jgi:Spy/CpxP family protein refolding chaperone
MRKTGLWGIMLVVGLMASNGFAQDVPAAKNDGNLNQQDKMKTIFSFKDDLAITDDQELKLKALLYDEQSFLDADNSTLKSLGNQLSQMIDKKEDMQVIKSKLEEIAKIQVEVSYRNIEDTRSIETILTPEQLDKWRDIQKKFNAQVPAKPSA